MCLQDGMFMDGLIYATISKNLANGIGSFWFPVFSENDLTSYHDQLPLFFGIQSVFFRILGNSLYVERIFSILMACLTAFFMVKTWRLVYKNNLEIKHTEWAPVLFWILSPVCFWTYINNTEEVLMSVFATASVFLILKGLKTGQSRIPYFIAAGACIFLCGFCKGFQGLFPLVTVGFYWLFFREFSFKKAVGYSLIILAVPAIITGILLLNETSHQSIIANINVRLTRTFNGSEVATVNSRFYLGYRLLLELIPATILMAVSYLWYRLKNKKRNPARSAKYAYFFIATGLSGSLPLMVTLEQRGFYLTTSLPFFALGLATLAAPYISTLVNGINPLKKGFKIFRIVAVALLIMVLGYSVMQTGKIKRDKDELHDVYITGTVIPQRSIISVPRELTEEFALRAYFVRYFNIYWDWKNHSHEYYFTRKELNKSVPGYYNKVSLDLKKYELYKRKF